MELVARMFEENPYRSRMIEVFADSDGLLVREKGKRKFERVHPGLNPNLDIYLANCASNFDYRIERV